jgi:hypothetical protein
MTLQYFVEMDFKSMIACSAKPLLVLSIFNEGCCSNPGRIENKMLKFGLSVMTKLLFSTSGMVLQKFLNSVSLKRTHFSMRTVQVDDGIWGKTGGHTVKSKMNN